MKALRATKAVYTKQLEQQVASIRDALRQEFEGRADEPRRLQKRLDEINKRQLASKSTSANYTRAKNTYIKEKLLFDGIRTRAQTQTMELAMPRMAVSVKQVAEPASYAARPRVALNLALGALVGLVVGLGLAFFIEYLDTSVKTMEDVENLLGVPVLAIIPRNIKMLHKEPGDTPDAEAYRILRTNIEFNRKNPEANALSVASGGPGEGKSTTLANLAFTSAQGGYTSLIVDADLRRPVQHTFFDLSNQVGLTNYLTTEMSLDDVIFPTSVENLSLLPSGILPSDAVGILNSQRMSDMIAELKSRYDIIFFDSPPMLGVSDASVLASEVDQTIIVVQHRRFPARDVDPGEAGGSRRRRKCSRRRLEQRRSETRSKLLLLHELLRLLPAARQGRKARAGKRPPPRQPATALPSRRNTNAPPRCSSSFAFLSLGRRGVRRRPPCASAIRSS